MFKINFKNVTSKLKKKTENVKIINETLRKKYPALQDAWEHYENVKQMCQTREKEQDEN